MIIVSISNCQHDNAVAVADDYEILAAIQKERLTRIKGDGYRREEGGIYAGMVAEALRIAGVQASDVGQVVTSRGKLSYEYFELDFFQQLRYKIKKCFGKRREIFIARQMVREKTLDLARVLNRERFLAAYGLPGTLPLMDTNHHEAHALSALFHTDGDNTLVYTADGGGDNIYYSASHFCEGRLSLLYGGDDELLAPSFGIASSVGQVYAAMTRALGYRRNRHEGKLTGLAAFGKPVVCDEIKKYYTVRDDGLVATRFKSSREMTRRIMEIGKSVTAADAAASVQKFLEDTILAALSIYLQKTGATTVALAGGVFANVALNRRIADLSGVQEVFIFPGMGDEGLAIGGIYDFLQRRDGMAHWASQRRRLQSVYWGGSHDAAAQALFCTACERVGSAGESPAQTAARLLAGGAIVALFHGRMEFGPRALGARSILASPAVASVNQTLNERLQRTEFMPFAPVVLEEDAPEVFAVCPATRYAMRFMTITTTVKRQWRDKIPAVCHVDGTARPQIIRAGDNPLYAAVLAAYKAETGLPVLVNTSFNVHEEPIVYTPEECLQALNDGRVDYVLLADGVYRRRRV